MKKQEILELISSLSLFRGISPQTAEILCKAPVCEYRAGNSIRSPENTNKGLIILLSGEAEVYSADSQKKVLLRRLCRGGIVGAANLFSESEFVSTVVAQKFCETLEIPKGILCELMSNDEVLRDNLLSFLSSKICYLNKKILCLTAGSAERRLAFYLDSMSEADSFELNMSMVALSEMLALGRASLYRAFDRLTEDGFIIRDGKSITLCNRQSMLSQYQ